MLIWLLQPHENTPLDEGRRIMRAGHLARQLVQRGADVRWWGSTFHHHSRTFRAPADVPIRVGDGYELHFLSSPGYRSNLSIQRIRHYRALAREFRRAASAERRQPDLIYCALPPLELAEAGTECARGLGVPTVVDILDTWPDVYLTPLPAPLRPLGRALLHSEYRRLKRICSRADALFAVAPSYLDWGLRHAGRHRQSSDSVIPLGYARQQLATGPQSPALERALDALQGRALAVFVGSLVSTADLGTVIEAARYFAARGRKDVGFLIIGDGPLAERWRLQAAGLPNIAFTGWLTPEDVTAALGKCDVGLVSHTLRAPQAMPNKIFDSLANGLPILCSLQGDAADLLAAEGIGLTYRAEDVSDFVKGLEKLLGQPGLRASMAQRARSLFEERFDADAVYGHMADRLLDLARQRTASASTVSTRSAN